MSIREHTCAAMRIRLEDALLEVGHVLGLFQDAINVGLSKSQRVDESKSFKRQHHRVSMCWIYFIFKYYMISRIKI